MPALDHGFKIVTHSAGRRLAQLGGVPSTAWAPVTSEVQTVERIPDRAFKANHAGEDFVVYMEAIAYWDDAVRWSVLAKSGLLSERERLPTEALVFVLHPKDYQPQGGEFRLSVGGRLRQFVAFREVLMWEQVPDASWEAMPGLMALYPVCRHPEPPRQAIVHAAAAIQAAEGDPVRRADMLTVLGIFGRLAYPDLDPFALIGRQHMRESLAYQQIMDEGGVLTARRNILAILEERLGKRAARSVEVQMSALEDLPRLEELVRSALRCETIDAFRDALEGREPPKRKRTRRP